LTIKGEMGHKNLMRIMGLDVGSKTIGVAISDELGMTAQGLKTIKRKTREEDLKELYTIISEFKVERIVVGLPKNLDGTLGKQAETVLKWVESLKERIPLPVETWDERLSTVEASRTLIEADLSREKRKRVIDKLAAVLILQGYLQQIGSQKDELNAPA
jgi:putative Holliday junction resolvase